MNKTFINNIKHVIEKTLNDESCIAFRDKAWGGKAWLKKKDGTTPTLEKTGALKNSIKFSVNKKGIEGSSINYGKYLNENGRQFMGVSSYTEKNITLAIDNFLADELDEILINLFKK